MFFVRHMLSTVQRRCFGTTASALLKQSRPETIYTFSTSYPRGQVSGRGGKRGGGFAKGPARLKLAPNRSQPDKEKSPTYKPRASFSPSNRRGTLRNVYNYYLEYIISQGHHW